MSDDRLFQNADEQEQAYAPDQRPADDPASRTPTDELGGGGSTGGGSGGTSLREPGTDGSVTGSTNRQANDASGQTASG